MDTQTRQPETLVHEALAPTTPSHNYVDAMFLCLAIGAFFVLGFQTLNRDTSSPRATQALTISSPAARDHFGGRISLISTEPARFVMRSDGERFAKDETLPGGAILTLIEDSYLALQDVGGEVIISLR